MLQRNFVMNVNFMETNNSFVLITFLEHIIIITKSYESNLSLL